MSKSPYYHNSRWNYGIVVQWNNGYYIIKSDTEVKRHNGSMGRTVELIPIDANNCTVNVSENWPANPKQRLDSIEWVADNVVDFIQNQMVRFIDHLSEKGTSNRPRRMCLIEDTVLTDEHGNDFRAYADEVVVIQDDEVWYIAGDIGKEKWVLTNMTLAWIEEHAEDF